MTDLINKFAQFFKPHLVETQLQPEIEVKYSSFSHEVQGVYREKWEELLAILDPAVIKSREWRDYGSGYKYEIIMVDLDGVQMKLEGAMYDAPVRERADAAKLLSQQEQADMALTAIFDVHAGPYGGNFVWALQHGTKEKVDATLTMLNAAAGKTTIPDELVNKAADLVIDRLRLAKDLRV